MMRNNVGSRDLRVREVPMTTTTHSPGRGAMIEVEDVSKSFGETRALVGVDMSVPAGTAHAALLADILDVLHGASPAAKDRSSSPPAGRGSPPVTRSW